MKNLFYSNLFYDFDQSDYLELFHKAFDDLFIPHFFMTTCKDTYKKRDYRAQVYPIEGIDILDNYVSLDKKTRILFISFFYKIYLIRNFKNCECIGIFLPLIDDALNNEVGFMGEAVYKKNIDNEKIVSNEKDIEKTKISIEKYNSSIDHLITMLDQFKLSDDSSFKQMITIKKMLQKYISVYNDLIVDINNCIENKGCEK